MSTAGMNNTGSAILISALTAIIIYCAQFQINFHWALWIVIAIIIAIGYTLAFITWLSVETDKELRILQRKKLKLECEKIQLEIVDLKKQ